MSRSECRARISSEFTYSWKNVLQSCSSAQVLVFPLDTLQKRGNKWEGYHLISSANHIIFLLFCIFPPKMPLWCLYTELYPQKSKFMTFTRSQVTQHVGICKNSSWRSYHPSWHFTALERLSSHSATHNMQPQKWCMYKRNTSSSTTGYRDESKRSQKWCHQVSAEANNSFRIYLYQSNHIWTLYIHRLTSCGCQWHIYFEQYELLPQWQGVLLRQAANSWPFCHWTAYNKELTAASPCINVLRFVFSC